jgi:hypothetical protein
MKVSNYLFLKAFNLRFFLIIHKSLKFNKDLDCLIV